VSLAKRLGDLYAHVEEDLSLRELGRLAGIAETYPSLIVSGEREEIGSKAATGLAEVLGSSTDWLLRGKGKPPTPTKVRRAVELARANAQQKRTGTSG
jgi:transcriptional regulator with XRE-family HTH domain